MEVLTCAGATRQFARFARENDIPVGSFLDDELKDILATSMAADRVPAHAIVDILQQCSAYTNRSDLGVSVVGWAKVRGGFGPLSLTWEYAPTLAETIRINQRFIHTENAAVGFHVDNEGDHLVLQHLLMVPARFGGSQFIEASLALDVRVARMVLTDEHWAPAWIEFSHSAPSDTKKQRAFFRCPIEFGSKRNAIVFKRDDLVRPAVNGNAQMFAFLERHMQIDSEPSAIDLPCRVRKLISAKLADGEATLEHVAQAMTMSPRTLQRHLAEHNLAFANLLADIRKKTAEEYFRTERRPNLTDLAYRLGYSDDSAASRYLRTNLQTGARALRGRKTTERNQELAGANS